MTQPAPILCERLDALSPAISHGFFTRRGGVSSGIFASLNAGPGSSDKPGDIDENRRRVAAFLGAPAAFLATPHQTHSADVAVVDAPWTPHERPKADAVVTSRPDLTIGVLTADCGPVLFADPEAGVVGAAHAGWKGAISGILENTIHAMERLGARRENMRVTLGPTISQANYEVGPDFVERLATAGSGRFFRPSGRSGHALFDLPGYILHRLEAADIVAAWTGHCTYGDEDRFFSYRRNVHRGESDYGRQISAISLRT